MLNNIYDLRTAWIHYAWDCTQELETTPTPFITWLTTTHSFSSNDAKMIVDALKYSDKLEDLSVSVLSSTTKKT